jgi:GT2 family glycosyltransferase
LKEAIDSLTQINIPKTREAEFVLVDKNENTGAKYIFDAYLSDMPFKCHYFVETSRGLSYVRNRVIEEALNLNASAIAMFDDDEIVAKEWLVELYAALKRSKSNGVGSTVYRLLPAGSTNIIKKFSQIVKIQKILH